MIEYKYILGTIAVAWPAVWALWSWYWKERKVKLSIVGYRFKFKLDKARIIRGLNVEIIIFNYDDRPLGIAEGGIFTNLHRHLFSEIYMGYEPLKVLPNKTIIFKNNLNGEGEKIKNIRFFLADDRKFNIKGQLIKRLNQRLKYIGTKYDELSPKVKNY